MARSTGLHTFVAELTAQPGEGDTPVVIEGASTQTADLFLIEKSDGTNLFQVSPDGNITVAGTATITGAQTFTGAAAFSADITLAAGVDLVLDSATGTKIGTATTQLLGFYNATPVDQPSAYTQTFATADKTHAAQTSADLATTGVTQTTPFGFATAAQGDNIATQFNLLRADLDDVKQLANSIIDDLQELGLVG